MEGPVLGRGGYQYHSQHGNRDVDCGPRGQMAEPCHWRNEGRGRGGEQHKQDLNTKLSAEKVLFDLTRSSLYLSVALSLALYLFILTSSVALSLFLSLSLFCLSLSLTVSVSVSLCLSLSLSLSLSMSLLSLSL
jgi:hypothetical protein